MPQLYFRLTLESELKAGETICALGHLIANEKVKDGKHYPKAKDGTCYQKTKMAKV